MSAPAARERAPSKPPPPPPDPIPVPDLFTANLPPDWEGAGLVGNPPEWQDLALCAQVDGELFFPDKGASTAPAKAICKGCEVRAECLEYAMENNIRFGIWGAASERERRILRRERGRR